MLRIDFTGLGKYRPIAAALNALGRWANGFRVAPPLLLRTQPDGSVALGLSLDILSQQIVSGLAWVQVTGAKNANGVYPASLYGDGPAEAATATDALVWLLGFDIDSAEAQGLYLSQRIIMDVGGSDATVYAVWRQFPATPASGDYLLMVTDGITRWSAGVECGGGSVP